MRKLSREEEPLIGSWKRQMSRHGLRRYLYIVLSALLVFLLYRWISSDIKHDNNANYGYKGELMTPPPAKLDLNVVRLEVYMESQCPDTSNFVHKQLSKTWSELADSGRVELTLIPFGKARCIDKGEDFECSCQHGANECILNQLMNCVIEKVGFPEKYLPIIDCIQGKGNLDMAMSTCINGQQLVDQHQMLECASGPRGRRLLALAGSRTVGLSPSLSFVPWVVINGERSTDAFYDLAENLCKRLEPAPEACRNHLGV